MSNRAQCEANATSTRLRVGRRCQANALPGEKFCVQHLLPLANGDPDPHRAARFADLKIRRDRYWAKWRAEKAASSST